MEIKILVSEISIITFSITKDKIEPDDQGNEQNWEQIRFLIDGKDILNEFRIDKQFHYGIDTSIFLAQENELYYGNILLGICSCRTAGDSDIMVNIHSLDGIIIWDIFNTIDPSEFDSFTFEKDQYEITINDLKNKITHTIIDAKKWSWMLDFSKTDLEVIIDENFDIIKKNRRKNKNIKYSSIIFQIGYGEMNQFLNDPLEEWEEVSPFINKKDILNTFKNDKQMRYGIDSSLFIAQEDYLFFGNILLGICGCRDVGCSDLLVNIHSFKEFVMWDIYVSWNPSKFETYFFSRNEYEIAINNIESIFKHKINDAKKWAWMFSSSKLRLKNKILQK